MNKQIYGKIGEAFAESYLKSKGYRIITVNFSADGGELDIIALHRGIIVFAEIKAKTSVKNGSPHTSVSHLKKVAMQRTARYFLRYLAYGKRVRVPIFKTSIRVPYKGYRFDLIEVLINNGKPKRLVHTEDII